MIYFDHNATTPLCEVARASLLEAIDSYPGNPSSPHRIGQRADAALEDARQRLGRLLDCDAADITWTSGATEANNMAMHHAWRSLPASAEVWISSIEHPCVLHSACHYFPNRHRLIPVTPAGQIDLDWLATELADRRPGLIAAMAANNETGVLQPWREILAMCRQYEVPYLCDSVQWIGKLAAHGLGACDFLSGCAHKFGGPKGVGFLKVPSQGRFQPLLVGGPQEAGRRAGTENVAMILSMVATLEARAGQIQRNEHGPRLLWRQQFESALLDALPESMLVGGMADRLWNTVSAIMPETNRRLRWVVKLDKAGFAVSTGSACSSGKETPSHVLQAMGFTPAQAGRVLRFSGGWETTQNEWRDLLSALRELHAELAGASI